MITANCRDRFTAEDFDFIVETLAPSERDSVNLEELLADEDARNTVLDHPRLFQSVLETDGPLRISPQLYFYVLTRHVLKQTGLNDRVIADYVASLLENFSHRARMKSPANGADGPIQYLSDMLVALRSASPTQAFLIRAHAGNYSLFITGIFHETVQRRSERGAPDVGFYEKLGRTSFKAAADHAVARSASLSDVFDGLAEGFREIRQALNRLSDTLVHLDQTPLLSLN
ncbi:MAG: hypothetical protein ABI680_09720 [Chthoniobacteraceae bacterium]